MSDSQNLMKRKNEERLIVEDIGIDIENISRFRNFELHKDRTLLRRIFTSRELTYCFSKSQPAQHLAVRFAAKEAVFKALSSFRKVDLHLNEIEIRNDAKGKPSVELKIKRFKSCLLRVSLSHCEDKAIAVAIMGRSFNGNYKKD